MEPGEWVVLGTGLTGSAAKWVFVFGPYHLRGSYLGGEARRGSDICSCYLSWKVFQCYRYLLSPARELVTIHVSGNNEEVQCVIIDAGREREARLENAAKTTVSNTWSRRGGNLRSCRVCGTLKCHLDHLCG